MMMKTLRSITVFASIVALLPTLALSQEESIRKSSPPTAYDFVVPLTDATFEHQTQASTGQTTGSWLVWFHKGTDETALDFFGEMPTEEELLEDHVVLGSVDIEKDGSMTAERFSIDSTPRFLFLHKGMMYRYEKPSYSWSDIRSFCRDPQLTHRGQPIPSPPSLVEDLVKHFQEDPNYAMSLIALLGASVVGIMFGRGKRVTTQKRD